MARSVPLGTVSAFGNRQVRQAAERAAAPQWRSLGPLRIVVTSDRLLMWFEHAWWSVWLSAITDVRRDPGNSLLDLFFDADPPYRLGCLLSPLQRPMRRVNRPALVAMEHDARSVEDEGSA